MILTCDEFDRLRDDYVGICTICSTEVEMVEPDAERYTCPSCGAETVYGIEQLLMMGKISLRE